MAEDDCSQKRGRGDHSAAAALDGFSVNAELRCSLSYEAACPFNFLVQPPRRGIIAVGPRWCAVLQKYPRKKGRLAKRLDHRAALAGDGRKIVLTRHPVAKRRPDTMTTKTLDFRDRNHRQVLGF